uniref:L-dopachrome isomerase n=1 Tax=Acrobeloides nanus TaxID=290746 RepID=A0A914E1U1_9BILA
MTILQINTNLAKSQIPDGFLLRASKETARIFGKPEAHVSVALKPDQLMTFSGTTEPCASVEVSSIGTFASGSNNQKIASEITELVHNELGIDKKRFYVVLTDLQADRVACDGDLLAKFFK